MNAQPVSQPQLFDFSGTTTGTIELFPEVWISAEGLTSPQVSQRHAALDRLLELDAPRLSPLVAYILATRIFDPDLELRYRIVQALGEVFSLKEGKLTSDPVRQHIRGYFSQLSRQGLLPILEVAEAYPHTESAIASLLNAGSHIGTILAEVMSDRKVSLALRRQAIHFTTRVGFLEAIPALERLQERLETRLNGQRSMPFAPPSEPDEVSLLSSVQAALTIMREP